jgi:beta-lactamase class A
MTWAVLSLLVLSPPQSTDLRARVQKLIAASGAEVAVVATDGTRTLLSIDPDKEFHAASTMKIPVMIELFREADAGKLSLDDPLSVKNEFHSIVDGSVFQLSVGDDSDAEVYKAVGKTMTLRQLCDAMITVSSNFAANLLIERLGPKNIQRTVDALGAGGMHVLRGVEDQKAFDKGMNNTTTAAALATLMLSIASGNAASPDSRRQMKDILGRQHFNDAIPAGLPPGTPVGHKTGNITGIHHDAAIIGGAHPYVLVVLVRGINDEKQSAALIASISREVWKDAEK